MRQKLNKCIAGALLAAMALAALPAVADNLYTSQTRARRVDDSSGYLTLTGNVEISSTALPPGARGGLGNRIGVFSATGFDGAAGYVRAKACFFGTQRTNDNETVGRIDPVAGPYSDGTFVWSISANYRPDDMRANCYFDGAPGIFQAQTFKNYENTVTTSTREFIGAPQYLARDKMASSQLNFLTGELKELAVSYGPYSYAPCEVDPSSAACYGTAPPAPTCPPTTYFEPTTGNCIASGSGG